jgi:hypothetical protein
LVINPSVKVISADSTFKKRIHRTFNSKTFRALTGVNQLSTHLNLSTGFKTIMFKRNNLVKH